MPLDTCITNVGEYYSSHYLDSTFTKDVKDLVQKWSDGGSQASPRRLQNLAQVYFRVKTQALDEEDPVRRLSAGEDVSGWHAKLLYAIGYTELQPFDVPVEGGNTFVPALGRVNRYNKPWLVVCETHFCLPDGSLKEGMPSEDPLGMEPRRDQLQDPEEHKLCVGDWSRCLSRVFTEEDAPRWVLFLAGSQVLLLDRNTFVQGRYLAFDLDDAFGRKEKDTFNHIVAFLAAEALCPGGESDEVLHDRLEEQSHRFAHGVTENLQFAVREAIEQLANEWARYRTENQKLPLLRLRPDELRTNGKTVAIDLLLNDDGTYQITAEHLKREALTFVYRLLFCFYAESRGGELEILPIGEDTYRLGYSLESLRDLEQVPLTPTTEEGNYFHEHLKKLFRLIHNGFHPHEKTGTQTEIAFVFENETIRTFTMRPLTATLFAPESTPLLNRARLSNQCLQAVIRRLSLSTDEKSRTIGRVNYAELGINQLGAVYEGLLSYRGMFADRDLLHVKPATGDFRDKKTPTWFVPKERLVEFKKDEVERLLDGKPRIYSKGRFILHLNGIDREQSASYYTPEGLTKSVVEESLRELLKDYGPQDADKILNFKICEPAMGSGAFLNEAADQLAHRYLELKQKQLGHTIDPAQYGDELRRVKHYIATRNLYGVDLNGTAVELGALSLWLGSIHRLLQKKGDNGGRDVYNSGATPWFGLRLRCGNSLIGARRAVWTAGQLKAGKHVGKDSAVPRLLKPGEKRGNDEIYHFVVFDEDMVPSHTDKLMRDFWPERCSAAKKWVVQQVKPRWESADVQEALEICDLIDQHWEKYAEERVEALKKTECTASVWPTPSNSDEAMQPGPTMEDQEKIRAELEATSGSFQRIKLIMDSWCALWFWSVRHANDLPSREFFLLSARLLLGAEPPDEHVREIFSARLGFNIDTLLAASTQEISDTNLLSDALPYFWVSRGIASEENFHHWELVFPEILGPIDPAGGFSLIVGNPPWIKVGWSDSPVLCELNPLLGVQGARSADINASRSSIMQKDSNRAFYFAALEMTQGQVQVLNNTRIYSELSGIQTNLYKNFMVRSWSLISNNGVIGLLHPQGAFDDANGGALRKYIYARLRSHFQFTNQLKLFPDVGNTRSYSINIYAHEREMPQFTCIFNLFHPKTIAGCLNNDGQGEPVPGIKSDDGNWNLRPHTSRVVTISDRELALFAKLMEEGEGLQETARLLRIHSAEALQVLRKLGMAPLRVADISDYLHPTVMFDETYGQRDGMITREDNPSFQPKNCSEFVITGPHFSVATPFFQTANIKCTTHRAYSSVDLVKIPQSFLPRSVFRPGNRNGNRSTFHDRIPLCRWGKYRDAHGSLITEFYRYANRRMIDISTERTLIATIIPPGVTHIDSVYSISFSDVRKMVLLASSSVSIIFDYLIRSTGKSSCRIDVLRMLPMLNTVHCDAIISRGMRLNCLTSDYASLWVQAVPSGINTDRWTKENSMLDGEEESNWQELDNKKWDSTTPFRRDYSRRQAQLEIDILVALALGLNLNDVVTIYRTQFPVMKQYERTDEYDALGRRLPNTERKDPGATQLRELRKVHSKEEPITVTWEIDDGNDVVTRTYYLPFVKVDREADYARAYEVFQQRYGGQK